MTTSGFSDMENYLNQMTNNAKSINGHHDVEIGNILTDSFINQNTNFSNLDDFVKSGNITAKDIQNMNSSKLDPFIQQHSTFNSFKDFMNKAESEWAINHIMPN